MVAVFLFALAALFFFVASYFLLRLLRDMLAENVGARVFLYTLLLAGIFVFLFISSTLKAFYYAGIEEISSIAEVAELLSIVCILGFVLYDFALRGD